MMRTSTEALAMYESSFMMSNTVLGAEGWGELGYICFKPFAEPEVFEAPHYVAENDEVYEAKPTRYTITGAHDAPSKIINIAPYSTELDAPHYQLRLRAQQEALGQDYAIVGVEAFNPRRQQLRDVECKLLKKGDFSSLTERVLGVAEHAELERTSESVALAGYSLGADVAAETADSIVTNPNRGILPLSGLSVVEPARVVKRGLIKMVQDMKDSGADLLDNVLQSRMPALNEAWGLPQRARDVSKEDRKKFDTQLAVGVAKYWLRNPFANWDITKGFGTTHTVAQTERVVAAGVPTFAARYAASLVCPPEFLMNLRQYNDQAASNLTMLELPGDHSSDDNLRQSAARMFMFAQLITESETVIE